MSLALACVCAWLLGGVPFGLVLVFAFKGVDVRHIGSGNVGATNASRAFGGALRPAVFLAIYLLDFAKGFVPTLWFPGWFGLDDGGLAAVLIGAAAVAGHCFSPYLGFHGGKGVATSTGVFAAIEPIALLVALAAFLVALKLTRQVFFGSLALGLALAVAVVLRAPDSAFDERLPATALAFAVAAFLFWTHRSNISRFRAQRSGGAA